MLQSDVADRARQKRRAVLRRMMPFSCEGVRDHIVLDPGLGQVQYARLHLHIARQRGQRVHRHRDLELAHRTATPDDAYGDLVTRAPTQHYLVDQAAQQRLPVRAADLGIGPEAGQPLAEADDFGPQLRVDRIGPG